MRYWIILIIALICFISCTDDKVQSAELNHRSSEQLLELAHQYIQKHDADSAMMCYSIVANRYSPDMNHKDLVLGSKAFNGLGFCYYFFYHDIPSAYDALMQAKDICKTTKDTYTEAQVCFNLAAIYNKYKNFGVAEKPQPQVVEYLCKSFDNSLACGDWGILLNSISNIAYMANYENCPEEFKCRIHQFKNLSIPDSIPNREFYIFNVQMANEKINGNYKNVINKANEQLLNLDGILGNDIVRIQLFNELAHAYLKLGCRDSAEMCINKAIEYAETSSNQTYALPFYRTLSNIYSSQGKQDLASRTMSEYYVLKDSVLSLNNILMIDNLDFISEIKQKNRAYRYNERVHHRHMQIAVSFVLLLLVTIPLLIILYRQNKKLKERNEQLFKQQQIRMTEWERLKQKSRSQPIYSMGHHRVLGNVMNEDTKAKIISIMDSSEEIYSPDFSLGRLAELVGSKSRVISSVLNDTMHQSFHELLNEYRVREACRRLSDEEHYGHLTIEAISISLGYKSRTTLLNAFKKQTGLTPTEYQRISRKQAKDTQREDKE